MNFPPQWIKIIAVLEARASEWDSINAAHAESYRWAIGHIKNYPFEATEVAPPQGAERDAVIEECAKVADDYGRSFAVEAWEPREIMADVALAIRALKPTPPSHTELPAEDGEAELREVEPGHWTSPEGANFAREYANQKRHQLCGGDHTDMYVATDIALLMRDDFDFEPRLSIAKDRIRWLSVQLAKALRRPRPLPAPMDETQ